MNYTSAGLNSTFSTREDVEKGDGDVIIIGPESR
jgi:hypothetical protein